HVRIDEAGGHRVHGNTAGAHFTGERTGKTLHAGLGRRVVGLSAVTHACHHGTDADDTPPAGLGHATQDRLGQTVYGTEIGADDVIPLVALHAHQQIIGSDTGIVHQDS